ncbi:MAG: tetratricopeptide repeat protein [Nitrospirae bacterium]|nr:tetratricopeptide repeat protein [Nitrospirota bacterium]
MNTGKYGRSSAALKQLLALDPQNTEARRLFATLHLRLGSLVPARQEFESLAKEAIERKDFWLAESLLREYLAAGPRCIPFLELLAHVHEEKGDVVAAVTELGKAIEILIEDPDSENPQKPSQLYTKVRELAPASSVGCQFASLFDIQTGELLVPRPLTSATAKSLEVGGSQPTDASRTIEEARAVDVMPWEQLDGTPPGHETLPPTPSNSVLESLDVQSVVLDTAPAGLAPQEAEAPPSESSGSIQDANRSNEDTVPSILSEPPPQSSGDLHDGMGEAIAERPPFVDEGLSTSTAEKRTVDDGSGNVASADSLGLSSPMPWEQIENSTIRIEEAASSMVPLVQSTGAALTPQPELVSDQLSSRVPAPDLTEPGESIFAAEPSTDPAELPEPEISTPSASDSSSRAPLSWYTAFDGTETFATGTLSLSSPATLSKPDATLQDAGEIESVQPELSVPPTTSTPELPVSLSDPESLPSAHPSIMSDISGSAERTDAGNEPEFLRPSPVLLSEEPLRTEEPPIISSDTLSSFMPDLPAAPQSAPVEPPRESEPVSTEHQEIPLTESRNAAAPPLSPTPSDAPSVSPASLETLTQWSTGEVEVQLHRPPEKKPNWDKENGEAPVVQPTPLPIVEESPESVADLSRSGGWTLAPSEAVTPAVEAAAPIVEKVIPQEDTRPEWVRESESITFVDPLPSPSTAWQDSSSESSHVTGGTDLSVAASAVDVLFNSTGENSRILADNHVASPRPRPRRAGRVARIRIGISSFIGTCFSTTRSIVLLCVGLVLSSVVLVTIGVGAIGLAWILMETPPSPVYHNLTVNPPQASTDSRKNGYFLLLGFEAPAEQNPLQVGYERKAEGSDLQAANACMLGDEGKGTTTSKASPNVVRGWFTTADPAAQMALQTTAIRSAVAQESLALRRYQQWLSMPFEDVGYGQIQSPDCAHILLAHRLYLAEGFAQGLNTGLERLETDMRSWRVVLEQSKTLMIKMLAATAVEDNIAIASGLLVRQNLDGETVGRLERIVRPLDPVELSLRWPMQSHLAWATKSVTTRLKNDKTDERPLHVALAAAMPLPVQRQSNAYADYYEAASKSVAEGRYTNLPKPSGFIRTPAVSTLDYLANPIEHIIGIEPLPSWDSYVGRMVEIDARLRLASLQVWIRRGAQEESALARLAKAGQAYYDPFTGLPMLLDQQRGVMYSVGQDGKDQEGDSLRDVVATIPKFNRS